MNKNMPAVPVAKESFHRVHRNFFVGLFIMVPIIAIPALFLYSFSRTELFQKWLSLYVMYDNAYGLDKGSAITISGMRIGYVNGVSLTPEGHIVVALRIQKQYNPMIRKNSHALLQQKNVAVGDWEIVVTRGDSTAGLVQDGDTLTAELPLKIDEVIKQVLAMVKTVDTILQGIAKGEGLVGHALKDDTLVRKVYAILSDVQKTVRDADGTVKNLNGTLASFDNLSKHFTGTSDSVNAILSQVTPLLNDTRKLIGSLDTASTKVPGTMEQVNKDLRQVQTLLKGLQEHWFFRGAVKKAKQKDPTLE
jgi:phospholipid/cholesterol/gamma-HCH transport system substrate-binding protein